MLKKRLIVFIAVIGILIASLCGIDYSYADDQNGSLAITIEHVTQKDNDLTMHNGMYIFSDYYSPITVTFKIDNLIIGEGYSGYYYAPGLSGGSESFSGVADNTSTHHTLTFTPSITSRYNNIIVQAYAGTRETNSYAQIYNDNSDFIELDNYIHIDSIMQDNNILSPHMVDNGTYFFELNESKPFSITMHFNQAMDHVLYNFEFSECEDAFTSQDYVSFTGAELKGGVTLTGQCWINDDSEERNLTGLRVQGSSYLSFYYGEGNATSIIRIYKDTSAPRITYADLEYVNFPSKKMDFTVDLRYHDQNNPLKLTFGGRNFSNNENYDITVKLFRTTSVGNEVEYEQEMTVSGQELNIGKSITLDTVILKLMDDNHLVFDANMYDLVIYYEDQHFQRGFNYGYGSYDNHLLNYVFLTDQDNERFTFTTGGARPGLFEGTFGGNVYAHYYSYELPENEKFDYEILKMPSDTLNLASGERVWHGTLTGKEIENGNIILPAEDAALYYILIKNDSGIIRWTKTQFTPYPETVGIESISASIKDSTLNIEYDSSFPHYKVGVGDTVKYTLHGKNFEENESFSVEMIPIIMGGVYGESGSRGGFENGETTKIFTGKELNEGNAYFELPYLENLHNELIGNWVGGAGGVEFIIDNNYQNSPTVYFTYIENEPSFSVKLNSNDTFEDEIDVFVSVDDYENMTDADGGIAALMGDVEYDEAKLELLSAEALNDFELVNGDHYVLHNIYGSSAPEGTNVLKLTFRNKGLENGESTTIGFTNISGSDGRVDITTADVSKTITHIEEEASIDSDVYTILDNFITKIATGTLVDVFRNGLELGGRATIRILSVNNIELSSSDKIGTGVRVQLIDRYGDVVSEFSVIIKGDISGDGEITITDLVKSKRHLAGLDNYTGVFQIAGDVSNTGAISITDVVKICRHVAGIEAISQ